MQIKEATPLSRQNQRSFRGINWNPSWYEGAIFSESGDTPVAFALQRMLKKDNLPRGERDFWCKTYEYIRLATRAGFPLKRVWSTWYLVWYDYYFNKYNKAPKVSTMLTFREKFLMKVEEWMGKKSEDLFRCSCCKSHKPRSHFNRDKSRANGISSRCKTCNTAYHRSRRTGQPLELQKDKIGVQYHGLRKQLTEASRAVRGDKPFEGPDNLIDKLIDKAPDILFRCLVPAKNKFNIPYPIDGDFLSFSLIDNADDLNEFLGEYDYGLVCSNKWNEVMKLDDIRDIREQLGYPPGKILYQGSMVRS